MQRRIALFAAGLAVAASSCIFPASPVFAERQPEVKAEVTDLGDRQAVKRAETARVDQILNHYLDQTKPLEKIDNDIRYLLADASKQNGEQLSGFLSKEVLPRSQELMSLSTEVTSRSSALRELHEIFNDYVVARHKFLSQLAVFSREKEPEEWFYSMSSHSGRFGSSTYVEQGHTKEYVSHATNKKVAALEGMLADVNRLRSAYYNRKSYIIRNKLEVIGEEK